MESPRKKKKIQNVSYHHRIDKLSSPSENLTTIILSDRDELINIKLMEGLKKQIGQRKIVKLGKANFKRLANIPHIVVGNEDSENQVIRTCPAKNLLFLGMESSIHIYDLNTKKLIREYKQYFKTFEVDSNAEFIYIISKYNLCKRRIDKKLTLVWGFKLDHAHECLRIDEGRKEIVICTSGEEELSLIRYNNNNGSLARTEMYGISLLSNWKAIHMEQDKELFYLLCRETNSDYDPSTRLFIFKGEDVRPTTLEFKEDVLLVFYPNRGYFICLLRSHKPKLYLYDKVTNQPITIISEFSTCSDTSNVLYFEKESERLFSFNNKNESIQIDRIEFERKIVDNPLLKETCLALERLGGTLPQIIPETRQDSVEYLLHVRFKSVMLWYSDNEIDFYFTFEKQPTPKSMLSENVVIIGEGFREVRYRDTNQTQTVKYHICVFVKSAEIENFDKDFPIYFKYKKNKKDEIKRFMLSEIIPKLRIAEHVKTSCVSYLILFENIYEELLQKGIIDQHSKEIDLSVLVEQYQNNFCEEYSEFNELGRIFQHSVIRFNGKYYKKIDLLLLSKFCSKHCFLKQVTAGSRL